MLFCDRDRRRIDGIGGGPALVEGNLRGGFGRSAGARHACHLQGVFGSYYDESRIVRILDYDVHWGLLARRSIARFADLQRKTGIPFYHESGHLALAERSTDPENYVNQVDRVARGLEVAREVYEDGDLHHRFPFLKAPTGTTGRFQGGIGGFISPRSLVRAQIEMATRRGVEIIPETAVKVRADREGVRVENPLETVTEVADWYRSNGNPQIAMLLREIVRERFPSIRLLSETIPSTTDTIEE